MKNIEQLKIEQVLKYIEQECESIRNRACRIPEEFTQAQGMDILCRLHGQTIALEKLKQFIETEE